MILFRKIEHKGTQFDTRMIQNKRDFGVDLLKSMCKRVSVLYSFNLLTSS